MSKLIGYWINSSDADSQRDLHQLLVSAVSLLPRQKVNLESRLKSHTSDLQTSGNFEIVVQGRHTVLKTNPDSGVIASLSASSLPDDCDIWVEASEAELILGRDGFGRATLFWTKIAGVVWFASHLELLLSVVPRPSISIDGFYAYSCMSYVPAPLTPVDNVVAVKAGTKLIFSNNESNESERCVALHEWREAETLINDEKHAIGCLRDLLEESAAKQAPPRSNEPVGVFLSGGLDSSLTAALLVRAGIRVRAYTLDFLGHSFSEIQHAEHVARFLQIPLIKVPVTPDSLSRNLAETTALLDGVYGDGVTVPLAILYKRASEEIEIVFNGEGGDQLFGGWTNKPLIAASLYEDGETLVSQYMRTFHRLYGEEDRVYSETVLRQIDEGRLLAIVEQALDPAFTRSLLHRLRRANLLLKGADNIQPRATNLALGYNLSVRTLFCSQSLADWTFKLSSDLLQRGECEKYLLKRSVEDLLPAEIVWREKRGMGVPLTLWLSGRFRRWVLRQMRHRVLAANELWQPDLVHRILDGELSGRVQGRRIGEVLWLMLMWQSWSQDRLGAVRNDALESRFSSASIFSPFTRSPKRRYT